MKELMHTPSSRMQIKINYHLKMNEKTILSMTAVYVHKTTLLEANN